MIEKVGKAINTLENIPMSIAGWCFGMVGIVLIRIFLEAFSNPDISMTFLGSALPTLLHFILFYIGTAVVTVTILSVVVSVPPLPMMRAMLFLMPIMWIGPIVDLLSGGARIAYIFATPSVLFKYFLTFFGPLAGSGATIGLRVEFVIIILMLGVYVYSHTKKVTTALLGMFVCYILIFAVMSLPSLLIPSNEINATWGRGGVLENSLISRNSIHPSYSVYQSTNYLSFDLIFDVAQSQIWYLILCLSGLVWFYRTKKNTVKALFRNIRPERVTHFLVVAVLGGLIAIAEGSKISWTILDFFTIIVTVLVITFAWIFAVITNDVVDESIDAISNKDRPLVTGDLTKDVMRDAAFVCGLMALVGALTLGSYATFWILLFSATYYIYSVPPLRLKRVPILASAFIGVATLAIMLLGFFLVSTNQQFGAFPAPVALLVFIFMTLVTNVRDLKDITGDSAAGIWTLPTLLGDRHSRSVIGVMMFVAYILVPIFIPIQILWIPSITIGIMSWIGLVKGRSEEFVFSLYFFYILSIVLLLIFA
jgi:4-hydroxybenzoate polyprenyltransferase